MTEHEAVNEQAHNEAKQQDQLPEGIFRYAKVLSVDKQDEEQDDQTNNTAAEECEWSQACIDKCRDNDDTMVTICCITYNHGPYIAEALESFVRQKTNFKFKVFVGDDASTDETPDIVRAYAESFPDIIVPFCHEENLGGMGKRNLIHLCEHATSPYIAFCEGDDFWIDEYKLQKQFDFMESHPDYRICFGRTRIDAPEDWYLRSYYVPNEEGELIIPECKPDYVLPEMPMNARQCINYLPCHTSTMFFRWNYGLEVPEWFFGGLIGDHPIFLMQLGEGNVGYIPDVVSVYRRSEVGVAMNTSTEEHFANTRLDYCHYLLGMREFVDENLDGYSRVELENRIKLEVYNYLNTALKVDDIDMAHRLIDEYPDAAEIAFDAFLSFYNDQRRLSHRYSWENYKKIMRDREFVPFEKLALLEYKGYKTVKNFAVKVAKRGYRMGKNAFSFCRYTAFTHTEKDPTIWAFTSFYNRGYLDNARYLFEYVLEHHPEIHPFWITENEELLEELKEKGIPVVLAKSRECVRLMSKAAVAVTDHFRMSDFPAMYGFNAGTKVVQLWHGVGFKALADGKNIKNTNVRGVKYSDDLLPQEGDSPATVKQKEFRLWRYGYARELFERYFMLVCPGQERKDMLAKPLHVQESALFVAGHPRNIDLYSQQRDPETFKIIYAPTYRFDPRMEDTLISNLMKQLPAIDALMEEIGGEFVFRLHPHTWRNYEAKIMYHLTKYEHITLDKEPDIYQSLGTYSLCISDYSSLAMDFAMLFRPVIFFCPDLDWFIKNEAGFNIDFEHMIPGPMTKTWDDTLEAIKVYYDNPDVDLERRKEKTAYYFDEAANGPDNSERIVQEIIRRLNE